MEYIERDLLQKLVPYLQESEYIAIIGPRQAGKTTLLELIQSHLTEQQHVQPEHINIISFEDPLQLEQFEKRPLEFVKSFQTSTPFYLFLDEFQYAQEGGKKLKLIYDRMDDVHIIITGSSSLEVKAKVGKYMVGRCLFFELNPLNFREYLGGHNDRLSRITRNFQSSILQLLKGEKQTLPETGHDVYTEQITSYFEQYSIWGGYPRVALEEDPSKRNTLLKNLLTSYIQKDVKSLFELSTDRELIRLARYLATQVGSTLVYQSLCERSGLNHKAMKNHLKLLEDSFVVDRVRPFFKNRQKELSKNPKIYFRDTGFRNCLMENFSPPDRRSDTGHLIENTVWNQLRTFQSNMEKRNFWRTKQQAEVDFILHFREEKPVPVEVKYSKMEDPHIPSGLKSFIRMYQPDRAFCLNRNTWKKNMFQETPVYFLPLFYL